MKLKLTVLFAAGVIAMGLLLGASAAQAEPVVIVDGTTATHIQNLEVDGKTYNVAFLRTTADTIYGPGLGYDFPDITLARNAKNAVNLALNNSPPPIPTTVGPSSADSIIDYGIGYPETTCPFQCNIHNGSYTNLFGGMWADSDTDLWLVDDEHMYADFTLVGAQPDPVTVGGSVTGLVGENQGLVLRNNGRDDETIIGNGPFTFDTPHNPGTYYDVAVATDPSNPDQACSVTNGSGVLPEQNVTNVEVTCDPPDEPPVVDTAFLPAVHLLLLGGDEDPPEKVLVPNVVGKIQASAEEDIDAAGLTLGPVTDQSSEDVDAGYVISQNPVAGTEVDSGSAVNLVISTGSGAQGPNVIIHNGYVSQIENLDVGGTFYNVLFAYGTASQVYSASYVFDFPGDPQPDDATLALVAVNDALNAHSPIPPGAGSQGSERFHIGYNRSLSIVNAMVGEYIEPPEWDKCTSGICVTGLRALGTDNNVTWAKFTEVSP